MHASLALTLVALAASVTPSASYSLSFATDSSCRAVFATLDAPDGTCLQLGDGHGYLADCQTHQFTFCKDAACTLGCFTQTFADARCGTVPSSDVAPMRAHSYRADCAAMSL
jgi:hypothetical protein